MAMNDKTFSEALTFTRATPKWVWNASGQLVEVPVDQPAYDHDPVTGESLGVLIEPGATNLVLSSVYTGSNWAFGSGATLVAGTRESPTGQVDAFQVLSDGTGGAIRAQPLMGSYQWTPNGTYTVSWYVFKASADAVAVCRVYGNDLSSSVTFRSNYLTSVPMGQWTRVVVTFTLPEGELSPQIRVVDDGSSVADLHIWGVQLEEGSVATSYIPTAGAAVTRAADNMSRTLTGPDINPQQGTFVFGAYVPESIADRYVAGRYEESRSSRQPIYLYPSGTVESAWVLGDGGVYLQSLTPDTPPGSGDKVIIAVAYNFSLGYVALSAYGKTTVRAMHASVSSNLLRSINFVRGIGSHHADNLASRQATRHVPEFSYYPYTMTEAELEALTTPTV